MTLENTLLLFPNSASGFTLNLAVLFLVAIFGFWLSPGGLAWALSKTKSKAHAQAHYAIPGPSGFPLLGVLLAFTGDKTHRVLAELSRTSKHGSNLMAFSVGFIRFVIASEPETAKGMLNSSAFADRPVKESAYELLFHRAMGFAPFGEYWRNLRRISSTHLFSPRRIAAFSPFRTVIGSKMVKEVNTKMESIGEVEVKKVLHFGSLNNVMMSVFGKCYDFSVDNVEAVMLEELVSEGYELLGVFNWSDYFPVLGWFDIQGVRRKCRSLVAKVNVFVGKIIAEHKNKRADEVTGDESEKDFVDVLLDLEGEDKLSDSDMIAVLWEMIFRGTDTVAILLEWIIARMVLHPDIQSKAQSEIDAVIGDSSRQISDSDIPNLPYLQAIVKETLRVHPPGPLLSWARLAIHDVQVGSNFVPAGTTAMVNMWAITHDENIWKNPNEFNPERFMEEDVSIMGSDLRLAPFGAGRRVCPGKALGLVTVQLWLAQLLQAFKWAPSEAGVDLAECLKMSLEMKKPLVCKALPRAVA